VRTYLDTAAELRFTTQKHGTVIDIGGGSATGGMVVLGWTACIHSDGTVDHSPGPADLQLD
jgi:hypothetical protein